MVTILMAMLLRENIGEKQQMSEVFLLMPLVYMICMGMFGNGVLMIGIVTMMVRLLTEVLGKVEVIVITECSVAVAGTAILGIAGVPGVTVSMPTTSSLSLGVFESSGLPRMKPNGSNGLVVNLVEKETLF